MKQLMIAIAVCFLAVSCGNEDSSSGTSGITISGNMGVGAKFNLTSENPLMAVDLSILKMHCVAFNAASSSGSSEFGTSGAFSVTGIPANTPFGCFVINKNTSAIVATLKIKDTATGLSDESSSSMSLGSSVSMGNITLIEGSSVVEVPRAAIAAAISTVAPTIAITDIHNTAWTMSCVNASDVFCAEFIRESPEVFFRILQATKSGRTIYGLGVWASQTAFNQCGGIDMTTAEGNTTDLSEAGDFNWTQNTRAATYANATDYTSLCPIKQEYYPLPSPSNVDMDYLQTYFEMDSLSVQGNMFALNEEEKSTNGGCTRYEKSAVSFAPTSTTEMFGNFESSEVETEAGPGNCGSTIENKTESFVVKFTKK